MDNADFTGINLKNLNLTNASAILASFSDMQMDYIIWNNVDFSSGRFFSVRIRHCNFVDAIFSNTVFMNYLFSRGILNDATILRILDNLSDEPVRDTAEFVKRLGCIVLGTFFFWQLSCCSPQNIIADRNESVSLNYDNSIQRHTIYSGTKTETASDIENIAEAQLDSA